MLNTQTQLPRSSTWLFSALLVAFGTTSAAAQHGRRDYDRDYRSSVDTTFSFDRRGQVSLTLGAGDIVVTGWSRDQRSAGGRPSAGSSLPATRVSLFTAENGRNW